MFQVLEAEKNELNGERELVCLKPVDLCIALFASLSILLVSKMFRGFFVCLFGLFSFF